MKMIGNVDTPFDKFSKNFYSQNGKDGILTDWLFENTLKSLVTRFIKLMMLKIRYIFSRKS